MASATLMNRFAKSVNKMGSGPFGSPIVAVVRVETIVEVISDMGYDPASTLKSITCVISSHDCNTSLALISRTRNTADIKRDVLGVVMPKI